MGENDLRGMEFTDAVVKAMTLSSLIFVGGAAARTFIEHWLIMYWGLVQVPFMGICLIIVAHRMKNEAP